MSLLSLVWIPDIINQRRKNREGSSGKKSKSGCLFKENATNLESIIDYILEYEILQKQPKKELSSSDRCLETKSTKADKSTKEDFSDTYSNNRKEKESVENLNVSSIQQCSHTKAPLYTLHVKIHEIDRNPKELFGFVVIHQAVNTEYSFSFSQNSFDEHEVEFINGIHKRSDTKPRCHAPVLTLSFHKYPDKEGRTRPCLSDRKDGFGLPDYSEVKSNRGDQKIINEEVLRHFVQAALNDMEQMGMKLVPAELPKHMSDFFDNHNCFQIPNYDRKVNLQTSSYLDLLLSFLTCSNDLDISPCILAKAGFQRKHSKKLKLKCHTCGLCLRLKDFRNKIPLDVHRERSPDCKFIREIEQFSATHDENLSDPMAANDFYDNGGSIMEKFTDKEIRSTRENVNCPGNGDVKESGREQFNVQLITDSTESRSDVNDNSLIDNVSNIQTNSYHSTQMSDDAESEHSSSSTSQEDFTTQIDLAEDSVHEGAAAAPCSSAARTPRYRTSDSRRASYRTWRHRNRDFEVLVRAGFYFTGEGDTVRCFQCDIGLVDWDPADDPWVEHARHSPDCPFLREQKDCEFIRRIQAEWSQIYTPKHPEMSNLRSRLESFTSSWPRDYVIQTPRQLAEAGFFFTGENDIVRCHYCDGGLREWEPEDDPWTDHARWFPFCKFVLKIKGIQFIQAAAVPEDHDDTEDITPAPAAAIQVQTPSFFEECRKKELKNPMYSAAAESVMSIGYSSQFVRSAIMIYIEKTGKRIFTASELLNIIFELEENGTYDSLNTTDADSINSEFELTPEALAMENRYIKRKLTCIICNERERQILFIPCGHRVTCEICAKDKTTCPECMAAVTSSVKTFLC